MIVFGQKSIHHWEFWRQKSKLFFCIASGLFYTLCTFLMNLVIRSILGHRDDLMETSFLISIGAFFAGAFFSIALWYENERRYKKWKSEKIEKI
ncbi:MAG TPA: hypothetical protein P5084_12585 [Paludibacter sp.]|nr:hypothetical protein [Paludibacter sp.]